MPSGNLICRQPAKVLTPVNREHRLPLTDFLVAMLKRRYVYRKHSEWVFQSSRLKDKHLSEGSGIVRRVRAKSGVHFSFHDLRRTFLTMGEKLDVPPYALKRLVNHSVSNDMTGRYLVLDIERLRSHMCRITDAFLELLDIDRSDVTEWKPDKEIELTEVTQLRIPLDGIRIM